MHKSVRYLFKSAEMPDEIIWQLYFSLCLIYITHNRCIANNFYMVRAIAVIPEIYPQGYNKGRRKIFLFLFCGIPSIMNQQNDSLSPYPLVVAIFLTMCQPLLLIAFLYLAKACFIRFFQEFVNCRIHILHKTCLNRRQILRDNRI